MSNIQFHTLHDDPLTVSGAELDHARTTSIETTKDVLGAYHSIGAFGPLRQSGVLPEEAFTIIGGNPSVALKVWLSGGEPLGPRTEVTINGERGPVPQVMLNTAAVAGPDPVAFLARLHGSVEHRLWVAADDAGWLADVLREGRASGVLREDAGWEAVIERLSITISPVVISTSAGSDFPDVEHDETDEVIEPADPQAAWLASLEEVQGQGWWQQLTPDNLRRPAYTPLTTFYDALDEKNPDYAALLQQQRATPTQ